MAGRRLLSMLVQMCGALPPEAARRSEKVSPSSREGSVSVRQVSDAASHTGTSKERLAAPPSAPSTWMVKAKSPSSFGAPKKLPSGLSPTPRGSAPSLTVQV